MPPTARWERRNSSARVFVSDDAGCSFPKRVVGLDVKRDQLDIVSFVQGLDKPTDRATRHRQLVVVGHAARNIEYEDVVAAELSTLQFLARRQGEQEIPIFPGSVLKQRGRFRFELVPFCRLRPGRDSDRPAGVPGWLASMPVNAWPPRTRHHAMGSAFRQWGLRSWFPTTKRTSPLFVVGDPDTATVARGYTYVAVS